MLRRSSRTIFPPESFTLLEADQLRQEQRRQANSREQTDAGEQADTQEEAQMDTPEQTSTQEQTDTWGDGRTDTNSSDEYPTSAEEEAESLVHRGVGSTVSVLDTLRSIGRTQGIFEDEDADDEVDPGGCKSGHAFRTA
jgi:hypothetical protein